MDDDVDLIKVKVCSDRTNLKLKKKKKQVMKNITAKILFRIKT